MQKQAKFSARSRSTLDWTWTWTWTDGRTKETKLIGVSWTDRYLKNEKMELVNEK